jgi:hypothetical protein
MNDNSAFPIRTTYTYNDGRPIAVEDAAGGREVEAGPTSPPPPSFAMAHDLEKRVFLLTGSDGKTEVFRDNPTRYLCCAGSPDWRDDADHEAWQADLSLALP